MSFIERYVLLTNIIAGLLLVIDIIIFNSQLVLFSIPHLVVTIMVGLVLAIISIIISFHNVFLTMKRFNNE